MSVVEAAPARNEDTADGGDGDETEYEEGLGCDTCGQDYGVIDRDEFKDLLAAAGADGADMAKLFNQMDKDGDGELTKEEIAALQDVRRNKFKAKN